MTRLFSIILGLLLLAIATGGAASESSQVTAPISDALVAALLSSHKGQAPPQSLSDFLHVSCALDGALIDGEPLLKNRAFLNSDGNHAFPDYGPACEAKQLGGSGDRVAITASVTFEDAWYIPFDEHATTTEPWHSASGTVTSVPIMHGKVFSAVARIGDGWVALLRLRDPFYGLFIVTGDHANADDAQAYFDSASFRNYEGFSPVTVDLSLPRVSIEARRIICASPCVDQVSQDLTLSVSERGLGRAPRYPSQIPMNPGLMHPFVVQRRLTGATRTLTFVPEMRLVIDKPFYVAVIDFRNDRLLFGGLVTTI